MTYFLNLVPAIFDGFGAEGRIRILASHAVAGARSGDELPHVSSPAAACSTAVGFRIGFGKCDVAGSRTSPIARASFWKVQQELDAAPDE